MNKKNIIIIIGILTLIVIVGGISYSYFVYDKDIGNVTLNTGDISISLSGVNGNQTLTGVIPLSDSDGMNSSDYFDFTVNSTVDTERIYYEVYILPDSENTLDTSFLKAYLTDQSDNELKHTYFYNDLEDSEIENGKVIYRGIVETSNNGTTRNETKDFRLRLWLDESYSETTSKTFDFDIYLYAKNVDDKYLLYDPCPGCKYLYSTDGMLTTWNTYDLPPTIFESDEYKDSYLDVVNESGKNYFLGIKLNSSNQVTNAYACGINNDIPFCIEGTSDGTNYRANETYLNSASLYNNTCIEYLDINTGYGYDYIECEPFDNSSLLTTLIYDGGDAVVRAEPGFNCAVSSTGYFVCNNPSGN